MYLIIQNQRVNFSNVLKYYVEGKSLHIVSSMNDIIAYPYSSKEKVNKVMKWLDDKFGVNASSNLVIEE